MELSAINGACGCLVQSHKDLCDGIIALAAEVQQDRLLTNLIRRKFSIKCTTGYSLNALVDFPLSDPIEIIKRLMIGSEGTFGFVARATYNTVPEWPNKVCRHSPACSSSTAVRAAPPVLTLQTRVWCS